MSTYPLVQLSGDLSADPVRGETAHPVAGGKTRADAVCTGPKTKEEKKRTLQSKDRRPWSRAQGSDWRGGSTGGRGVFSPTALQPRSTGSRDTPGSPETKKKTVRRT
jgi:hypothetical protein